MEPPSEKDPDFRSIVNDAAANWYSQRSISPSQPRSTCKCPNPHTCMPMYLDWYIIEYYTPTTYVCMFH